MSENTPWRHARTRPPRQQEPVVVEYSEPHYERPEPPRPSREALVREVAEARQALADAEWQALQRAFDLPDEAPR